jgi:hypothetical protein
MCPASVAEVEWGKHSMLFAEGNKYAVGGMEPVDNSGRLAAAAELAGGAASGDSAFGAYPSRSLPCEGMGVRLAASLL